MIRTTALALALTTIPLAAHAQTSAAEQARRDAWALERIADVSSSGRAMPRDVMREIVTQSLETLRGGAPDGTYRWARYERQEAERQSEGYSLRPTGADAPDSFETSGDLAYAIRIEVPSRRLLVVRNRRVFIDRIEVDYRELGAFRDTQVIEVDRWIEPGDGVEYPLEEITRRASARVIGWADPEERGSAAIEVSWLVPTLVDDPTSPFAQEVAILKQIHASIDDRDQERTESLAQQLATELGRHIEPQRRSDLVIDETVARVPLPIGRDELLYELRTVQELMRTGGVSARGTADERLRELIRRVESLPVR